MDWAMLPFFGSYVVTYLHSHSQRLTRSIKSFYSTVHYCDSFNPTKAVRACLIVSHGPYEQQHDNGRTGRQSERNPTGKRVAPLYRTPVTHHSITILLLLRHDHDDDDSHSVINKNDEQ
jgi:hypothetical protein